MNYSKLSIGDYYLRILLEEDDTKDEASPIHEP